MFISIDAGGTNTRVAGSLELNNPVFVSEPLRRRNVHDFSEDLGFMVSSALQIARNEAIEGVGIGAPGVTNEDKTELISAKNLGSWSGKPLVASLISELHCPVFLDVDIMAGCYGEVYYGSTEGDFDYIIWGTGIGGGFVRRQGDKPNVSIMKNWRERFADWEMMAGGAELTKRFGKPPEDFTVDEWAEVATGFTQHLQQYVETYRPPALVFSGGLAVRHAELLAKAGEDLGIKIAATEFGNDSGLFGGFGLIKRNLG